ncbi:unnamed protein product [Didymodactylos carnosus]|uniref:ANK_REP_REGION domain-containing protein n=1 Tax=Didymodactylos carnosus TaxID=1234261 RepID=A0A814I0N7_9BILA|nr:unnamed protein product [Didymodactylos carnosus]CAF3788755.1 unnamed protein product [Didymodactylos carnosus]
MLSVPLSRVRSSRLKRQTPVAEEEGGDEIASDHYSQTTTTKRISSDHESVSSSRSLSPYLRVVLDGESSSSYLDVPETSINSRRSSNNSVVRFKQNDMYDLCSILDMTYEGENLEKAIINNDKYTARRIIDIHQNKFSIIKNRHSILQGCTGGAGGAPVTDHRQLSGATAAHSQHSGTPSLTSNTDLIEAVSKEGLLETNSLSNNNGNSIIINECCLSSDAVCETTAAHSALTQRTGPLAAALMEHASATPSPINFNTADSGGGFELEKTATRSAPDSPSDAPPIFRNILHVAIIYDARDVLRISLKYGIDPNAPGTHPVTSDTSTNSGYISPDLLPRASPCRNGTLDYNSYYTNERLYMLPPLFLAAQRNNHYATNLLLRYGANPNIRDELACSPLHLAARLQHDVCNILICHHACISIKNKYGDSALSLWPVVYNLQTAFVEREFRKLCRKYSSSKRHRFLSSSSGNKDETHLGVSTHNNNSLSGEKCTNGGVKNLKRIFRHSGSDSYDSKSFKKSLSSQSSIGKPKVKGQHVALSASTGRSESRQISEEREEYTTSDIPRSSNSKRKIGTPSIAVNILNYHKSFRNYQPTETRLHY